MATNYPTFQSDPTLNSVTASSAVFTTNLSASQIVAGTGRFTSNVEVTGTIKSTSTIYAPGIDLSNSAGYANIEVGGPSGAHIDLKRPYTDDYDIRLISDNNIEGGGYLITSSSALLSLSGSGVAVGQYSSAGYKFLVGGTTRLANTVEIGQSGTLSLYDNATQVVIQYPNKQVNFYDSTNLASRMLIDTNGNVGIGATTPATKLDVNGTVAVHNIKFPSAHIASADVNTLDDYEEGAWTPALSASTTNNYSYTSQSGRYIKIGRLVTCYGYLRLSSTGSSSGFVSVSALPFSGNSFGTLYVDYMNAFSASVTTPIRGQSNLFATFNSFSLLFSNDTSLQNTNLTNTSGFAFFISYQATS